jgi:RHS repeat-associated protein
VFSYDARNRCVTRNTITHGQSHGGVLSTTTNLYYDGWNLIEEQDSYNGLQASYVHGAQTDEILARDDGIGILYYRQDALGSTVALTDANGDVVERYKYDVYGAPTILDPSLVTRPSSLFGNRFLFTGREYLAEAKLYDYRNRIYSSELGRFLQTDPIRFGGKDVNLYRYAHNSPASRSDPSGRQEIIIDPIPIIEEPIFVPEPVMPPIPAPAPPVAVVPPQPTPCSNSGPPSRLAFESRSRSAQ